MNIVWWEIDIHGCYLLVKFAFAPMCACKNNRRIWRHNASTPHSRDVTDQHGWRHNVNQKNVLSDNGEINNRYLFLAELCIQDMKWRVRNKLIHSLLWIMIFGQPWSDLPMIFTCDFVTRENYWQIASLVTRKPPWTIMISLILINSDDGDDDNNII